MNTYFSNPTINLAAYGSRTFNQPFDTLKIRSVSGIVLLRLNSGDYIKAAAGDVFTCLPGENWNELEFYSEAGGDLVCIFGRGNLGASGGGSGQTMSGTAPDPNVAGIVPDDANKAATYFADTGSPALWNWSTSTQLWV
jgi:hypothetical protein